MSQPRPPRATRRPRPQSASSPSIAAALRGVLAAEDALRATPATDAQLATVWQFWNALPAALDAEERHTILTKAFGHGHQDDARQYAELQRRFPRRLPLGPEFHQVLVAALEWTKLVEFSRSTLALHLDLVRYQWAYRDADDHRSGRIAIWRTAAELAITHPHLEPAQLFFTHTPRSPAPTTNASPVPSLAPPTLAEIAYVRDRSGAYQSALTAALTQVEALICKPRGMEIIGPLPLSERAWGHPMPPLNVPRHRYIARLKALGMCSAARYDRFVADELPKLPPARQHEFRRIARSPRCGKDMYPGLLVWLIDNRPIFELPEFGWRWKSIHTAAKERGLLVPNLASIQQWAHEIRVPIKVQMGPSPTKFLPSDHLLSVAPIFGDHLTGQKP